jgi:hypothetical protein
LKGEDGERGGGQELRDERDEEREVDRERGERRGKGEIEKE